MRRLRVLFGTLLLCLGTAVVPIVLTAGGGTAFASGTSGSIDQPQPFSTADQNNVGANDTSPSNPYLSTRDGSPSMNGQGNGNAYGKPCAGCVGKADNKNPPGQAPNGSDPNAGYECDTNSGIGQSNPAHTGCVYDPSVSTQLSASSVQVGTPVYDTATLNAASTAAYIPTGTVTYDAYAGGSCSGTPVFTDLETLNSDGSVPASKPFTATSAGTYSWQATYSGDSHNAGPVSSTCGTEELDVTLCPTAPASVSGSSAWVSVGVSNRFDNPTFQDSGATAAPGQKIQYLFCYGNNGSTTLSNVTLSDQMAQQLVLPFTAIFQLPAGASIVGGTPYASTTTGGTLIDNFGSLSPGQQGSIQVVMSIGDHASGVITNTPTLSATGLTGSTSGNQVTTNVGYLSSLPALSSHWVSTVATGGDTFSMTWQEQDASAGGNANDVRINAVAFTNGVVVTSSFPIMLGNLAPGATANYTIDGSNPNGATSASVDILEQATGADGHLYYFD